MEEFNFEQSKKRYKNLINCLIKRIPTNYRDPVMTVDHIVIEAYIYSVDNNTEYEESILKVFSRQNWDYAKAHPRLAVAMNEISRKWQRENRDRLKIIQDSYNKRAAINLTDTYIKGY